MINLKKTKVTIIEPDITEEENTKQLEKVKEVLKIIALEMLEDKENLKLLKRK